MAVFGKVLGVALAASAAFVSTSASAATVYSESGRFFYGDTIDVGAFDHTFYSVPGLLFGTTGNLAAGAQTVATIFHGTDDLDFTGFYLVNLTQGTQFAGVKTTPTALAEQEWYFGSVTATDRYALRVTGISYGNEAGFNGSYRFSATPEAGTWMMMVAGFGLMGAAMRRRPRTQVTFA